MSWRYQPVFEKHKETGITEFSVCEVYLTEDDKLKQWSAGPCRAPRGNDINDLQAALTMMSAEVFKWQPVEFRKLRVGMKFKRK